ncbi:MAG: efflux RND transporter periplasmic adaptor subunit [Colwellia sp.]|nr:efflux RND transporter periplasmic adaptor subunit [Colwellia sp.]
MDKPITQKIIKQRQQQGLLKTFIIMISIIVLFWLLFNSFTTSVNRDDIRTAKVIKANLKTELQAGGIIMPIEEETIASHLNSHISEVFVQAGQQVSKGQPLMSLDTTNLQLTIANMSEEIALKENKILSQNLQLEKELNEHSGKLELLAVDLESRQTELDRYKQLSPSGGVSQHKLTEKKLNVKRTSIEIRQLNQRKKNSLAAAIAKVNGLKLEQSILIKSQQDKQRQLTRSTVLAPKSGLVVWLKNEEGSAVTIGESLIKIADTSSYKVIATISDFYANQLWQGMDAEFQYNDKHYYGKLTSIIGGDQQGILSLAIELNTEQSSDYAQLRQKQRVDISLITGVINNALLVSKGPFINGSGLKKVFVINQDLANRFEINIGAGNRHYYQIKQGLAEGDEVIISDVSAFYQKNEVRIN